MKRIISILLLLLGTTLFSQETTAQKNLLKRANENFELLRINPEKAFQESKKITQEALQIKAEEAELRSITTQCQYFKFKIDFENMMITAKLLFQKAKSYNNANYQVIAKTYLSDSYIYNNLPNDAVQQLNEASEILKNVKKNDSLGIVTRSNLFTAYSDYYLFKGEYDKVIRYVKKSIAENNKFLNSETRQKLQHIEYANLALAYMNINYDSARYYAKLSLSVGKNNSRDDAKMLTLGILGEIAGYEGDYKEALFYFQEAEKLKGNTNHVNLQNLYDRIIEAYRKLNETEKVKIYEVKKDSLKLTISESQNKSLHNLLNERNINNKKNNYIIVGFCVLAILIIFLVIRKNRILAYREKISQQYLKESPEIYDMQGYFILLDALKKNDPAFMIYFDKTFPVFAQKLKNINPKIVQSEMEFCALIKLKIPTKDISRYRFIEPKTVRNKKHLIRKKFNIPKDRDIYQWFDEI